MEFEVPLAWNGRQIFLRFDGVKSAYYCWLNGVLVGYSQDSMSATEFDITPLAIKGGKNLLAVEVFRWSDGSYLERQDFWDISGIYRDVTLFSTPKMHLRDIQINTSLDATLTTGIVTTFPFSSPRVSNRNE